VTAKSNAQISAESLARLGAYLDAVVCVPERHGKANVSAIAKAARVDRQVLYREDAKALVVAAVAAKGLEMPGQQRSAGATTPTWTTQRIKDLEERVAVVQAENRDLRDRLHRFTHIEQHLEETGRLAR
jgi:hypothetical protein